MLAADQLASARATVESSLTDELELLVAGTVDDGIGGRLTEPFAVSGPRIKCRLAPGGRAPLEAEQGGKVRSVTRWRAYLPHGTVVDAGERVRVYVDGAGVGVDYHIIGVMGGRSVELQVVLELERVTA